MNAYRGPLGHRLDYRRIPERQLRVYIPDRRSVHLHPRGRRDTVGGHDLLGEPLVHGRSRGQDSGPGVGNPHHLEQALHRAVFAQGTMQGHHGKFDPKRLQPGGQVTTHVHGYSVVAQPQQRTVNGLPGPQRDVTLRGEPTHQHADSSALTLVHPFSSLHPWVTLPSPDAFHRRLPGVRRPTATPDASGQGVPPRPPLAAAPRGGPA